MVFEDLFDETFYKVIKPIRMLKKEGYIPEFQHHIFPDNCPCGSERIGRINEEEITSMTCVNPTCPDKSIQQMDKIFKRYTIKGIGPDKWKQIIQLMGRDTGNPAYILTYFDPESLDLTKSLKQTLIDGLQKIKSEKITLEDFLDRLHYPALSKAYGECIADELEENLALLVAGNFSRFREKYNINYSLNFALFEQVIPHVNYILDYYCKLNIFVPKKQLIPICMTGNLSLNGVSITKNKYIDYLEDTACKICEELGYEKVMAFSRTDSVAQAGALIAGMNALQSRTDKIEKATPRHEFMLREKNKKFIFTADQFLEEVINSLRR